MKEIRLDASGEMTPTEKYTYGGQYSFFDKIKLGGIGSQKIVYESGLQVFEEAEIVAYNEVVFFTMELLKNGLILYFNKRNANRAAGLKLDQLKKVNLTISDIPLSFNQFGKKSEKIIQRGLFKFEEMDNTSIDFSVFAQNLNKTISFFSKKPLVDKFELKTESAPAENDYAYLIDVLSQIQ